MSQLALQFKCNPLDLDEEQILDYLFAVKVNDKTPSESYFKHTVYGLRYAYRIFDMDKKRIQLPSIERSKKLPVVLSREEVKLLLKTPRLLKHRILLGLLYGCGLRCFELRNLQLTALDFDRKMLHIVQGKGRKDRYVPLCDMQIRGLKTYIKSEHPQQWCFNGHDKDDKVVGLSARGVQWVVKQARKESGIQKQVTTHVLRHSYATHLLEMGLDIMSLKDLLGHSDIQTTLVYLHISQLGRQKPFSPLDKLYSKD